MRPTISQYSDIRPVVTSYTPSVRCGTAEYRPEMVSENNPIGDNLETCRTGARYRNEGREITNAMERSLKRPAESGKNSSQMSECRNKSREVKAVESWSDSFKMEDGRRPRTREDASEARKWSRDQTEPKKRAMTAFTPEQIKSLEDEFGRNKYLAVGRRLELSKKLRLTETQVSVYFDY